MSISYLLTGLISFLSGAGLLFFFKKISLRYKPSASKQIPVVGGVGIGLSFILTYLFIYSLYYRNLSKEVIGVIIASLVMLIFGIIDDWRELSVSHKFLAQIIAVSLLVLFGVRTQIVHIGNLLNIIITFVWVIGITNAFNHLDVADGVAGGCALIVGLSFSVLSILNQDLKSAVLSLTLIGAVSGFLIYNFPPARVYLGNSGSHFLGFTLSAIALMISYAPLDRRIALISPILILGFPIFDTAFVSLMRIRQKKSAFLKSDDHLALRFLKLGFSKAKALMFILFFCLFFSLSGVALSRASNFFGASLIAAVVLFSVLLTLVMSKVS